MSIIHEALKKVEKSVDSYSPAKEIRIPPPGRKINKYLIYALIFCFGLFIENTFFLFILRPQNTYRESQLQLSSEMISDPLKELPEDTPLVTTELASSPETPSPAKIAEDEPEAQRTALVLNGIFFSQDDGYYALINNKIVKVGDDVDGAIVKYIDLDNVELESEAGLLVKLSRER
ncbi:MAG: hypothetical protein QME65_04455 [Candidatus Omnitrophota bacterium]|nr:hypothetical protein [Candidatus Omnitrophota bacterium]